MRSNITFVRSGGIDLSDNYLRVAGSHGYYWLAASGGAGTAYGLNYDPINIYPTYLNLQYYGFSARCLASGA